MRLLVFEDDRAEQFDPLTLTRPAFELWCGAGPLLERQCRYFRATEVGFCVRQYLADWCRFRYPAHPVNEGSWAAEGETLLVNARWLPPAGRWGGKRDGPHMALAGGQIAYALVQALPGHLLSSGPLIINLLVLRDELEGQSLPQTDAEGSLVNHPWDLTRYNGEALAGDLDRFRRESGEQVEVGRLPILGQRDLLFLAPSASVEPLAVIDTTRGPVIIDRHAVVQSFSRLEGPCYVGRDTVVRGAQVRDSTIGPQCRVGGEVEASILQGYSNKAHDGFLGHSYVGEWVNLAAGTQVSDLRNDYGGIRVSIAGANIDTGQLKVGAFLGDHTRTGVGTLLNCGTVAGAFAQFLPWSSYQPRVVPSFCTVWSGKLQERVGFRQLFATAAAAMQRRGQVWKAEHSEFFLQLYELTAGRRQEALGREVESRQGVIPFWGRAVQ
jgi:UDP-N-acetylglucosamine diphosphorylase/glucosamine-1-phosphate N-acetyltransferase